MEKRGVISGKLTPVTESQQDKKRPGSLANDVSGRLAGSAEKSAAARKNEKK